MIPSHNYGYLHKVGWSRSSRTDKGVHSLCTVIGVKLEYNWNRTLTNKGYEYDIIDQCKSLHEYINQYLPDNIRVFSINPVRKHWDARSFCNLRKYEYIIPYELFEGTLIETDPEKMKTICNYFVGSHSWHNYTSCSSEDVIKSTESNGLDMIKKKQTFYRKIHNLDYEIITIEGEKFIKFTIIGQSFLMHQIRKIISSIYLSSKCYLPEEYIYASINSFWKLPVPKFPTEGLYLDDAEFRCIEFHDKSEKERIHSFKYDKLLPHIKTLWKTTDSLEQFHKVANYFRLSNINDLIKEYDVWKEAHLQYLAEKELRKQNKASKKAEKDVEVAEVV